MNLSNTSKALHHASCHVLYPVIISAKVLHCKLLLDEAPIGIMDGVNSLMSPTRNVLMVSPQQARAAPTGTANQIEGYNYLNLH